MWLQVIDLLWDVIVCLALMNCDVLQPLLIAWTSSLVVTVLSNLCVGWRVLRKLGRSHRTAEKWIGDRPFLTTLVLFASASRIESLSVLRCLGMRMPDRHFNFLRFEGAHHYVLADLPHLMVAIAMLWIGFEPYDVATHQNCKLPSQSAVACDFDGLTLTDCLWYQCAVRRPCWMVWLLTQGVVRMDRSSEWFRS